MKSNALPLSIVLIVLIALDLAMIAGILIKGHANFPELYKHLIS